MNRRPKGCNLRILPALSHEWSPSTESNRVLLLTRQRIIQINVSRAYHWWPRKESNLNSHPYEGYASPLSYRANVVGRQGFEPCISRLKAGCLCALKLTTVVGSSSEGRTLRDWYVKPVCAPRTRAAVKYTICGSSCTFIHSSTTIVSVGGSSWTRTKLAGVSDRCYHPIS